MLWDDITSDFPSLQTARALIAKIASHLAMLDELGSLRDWLAAEATDRQTSAAACDRLSDLLNNLIEAGFGYITLADLPSSCTERVAELKRLAEASQAVGVQLDARFQRPAGGTVADAILKLHEARETFDELKSDPMFEWVGDVATSLQMLEDSLAEVDAVGAATGPIDILSLLKDADTPAALLSSICDGATDLSKASKGWEEASDRLWDTAELDVLDLCEDMDWRQAASKLRVLGDDRGGASLAADLLKYRASVAERDLAPFADAATSGLLWLPPVMQEGL